MVSFGTWPSSSATVKVPAHPDMVASIRAMTRSMAVLADIALEDAEELQMAVDEAAILLLPLVDRRAERAQQALTADFEVDDGCVRIVLSAPCADGAAVDRDGLPWMMLGAMSVEAEVAQRGGRTAISVVRRRAAGVGGC